MGQYTEFTAPDKHLFRAYVARPTTLPRGALVLLHEMDARSVNRVDSGVKHNPMPGVSQRIRNLAKEHASRGYLVVAPSLFGRGRAGKDHGYRYQMTATGEQLMKPLQPIDSSRAMADIQTVVAWAQSQLPQGKVGIMGFCWGGLLAWQAACTMPQVSAATSFYGGGMTNPQILSLQPMCPVLVHLPAKSLWMTQESMAQFVAVQRDLHDSKHLVPLGHTRPMVQIYQYEARYGFDQGGSRLYDPAASQSARLKTSAFFDTHLNF